MDWWQQLKNIYHYLQAQAWRAYFGWPDKKLTLYGVTGTNGKTTTSLVLGSILRAVHGEGKVGVITTEIFWFGKDEQPNATHMTSLNAKLAFRYLRRMVNAGVTHAVAEMTSHALHQHRWAGIKLDGAIILNIQHEHLDYHKTMEGYARAKGRIINYLKLGSPLIARRDSDWVEKLLDGPKPIVNWQPITWYTAEEAMQVSTPLAGDFNKENSLAASLLARAAGIEQSAIDQGVAAAKGVPGRAEWLDGPNGSRIMIDFALTPYAYENLFKYLRSETSGKLIGVFGAAGRRDKEKRPHITKAVAKYANEIVITQDEPYDDPEEEIYSQLESGLADATIEWRRIEDREEAIRYALKKVGAGDVVAVVGMGNFDSRMVGDEKIPWNDKEVAQRIMKELSDDTSVDQHSA